jgi:Ser/Thr protein kinase RdoA (MazF antagonist)
VLLTDAGVVGINWRGAGRGPRLSDLAWLLWGTHRNPAAVEAIVDAYRRHIELTEEELDRLEAVMYIRPLYLTSFGYRRNVLAGWNEDVFAMSDPDYIEFTATAARAAFHQ